MLVEVGGSSRSSLKEVLRRFREVVVWVAVTVVGKMQGKKNRRRASILDIAVTVMVFLIWY